MFRKHGPPLTPCPSFPHIAATINKKIVIACTSLEMIVFHKDSSSLDEIEVYSFETSAWVTKSISKIVDVYLDRDSVCDRKINAIKEVRVFSGIGLKEAKDLVEGTTPSGLVKAAVPLDQALRFQEMYTDISGGGKVILIPISADSPKGIFYADESVESLTKKYTSASVPYPSIWDPSYWHAIAKLQVILNTFANMELAQDNA